MSRRQHNEVMESEVEVKLEPQTDRYTEEEAEGGFVGFDNASSAPCGIDAEAPDLWTSHATSCLISQYNKYYRMVGQSARFRSRREMFEVVSLEMQQLGYRFGARKCENKWRVLERKYKNLLLRERLNKPGRIKHYGYWEHRVALDEIFEREGRCGYPEGSFLLAGGSPRLAVGDAMMESDDKSKDDRSEETSENEARSAVKSEADEATAAVLRSLLAEVSKSLALAETNRERRHREKMAVREAELEVRRKLLKLKEQKMEIWKSQMTSAAHSISFMK